MSAAIQVLTGISCAGLSGLRSTVPLFLLGMLHREYPDTVQLGDSYTWLGETWAVALIGILMCVEIIADKIPHLDHVLHVILSVLHTTAGAVAILVPIQGDFSTSHIIALVFGGLIALIIHIGRAALRFLSTAVSGGMLNCCVSIAEDIIVFILCPLAVMIGAMAVVVAVVVILTVPCACYARHRRNQKEMNQEDLHEQLLTESAAPVIPPVPALHYVPAPTQPAHGAYAPQPSAPHAPPQPGFGAPPPYAPHPHPQCASQPVLKY